MTSNDILPTYEEVMKTYQTPAHVLRFEARTITYAEESSVSKIKSFLARPDHSHTDDVHVKKTRKSKVAEKLVKVLTGACNQRTIAIIVLADIFESPNPKALLNRLESLEEFGSGKTVTLRSLFHQECFQYTIIHRTWATLHRIPPDYELHTNTSACSRPDRVTQSPSLPLFGTSSHYAK
jgi:hypothetical protein